MPIHNHPDHEPEDFIYLDFVEPIEDVDIEKSYPKDVSDDDIAREAVASLGHFTAHYGEL